MLTADLAFGTESVKVGDVTKEVDVCALADALYDALENVPKDTLAIKEFAVALPEVNAALAKFGFPALTVGASAFKFAQDAMARALDLKKEVRDVWRTEDEPASQLDIPDSE